MSPDASTIQEIIAASLVELRSDLGLPALPSVEAPTPLLGGTSDMDSMAIVHLIADLEGRLQVAFGKDWILADERALSRHRSPFRTVGDLTEFILETTPKA